MGTSDHPRPIHALALAFQSFFLGGITVRWMELEWGNDRLELNESSCFYKPAGLWMEAQTKWPQFSSQWWDPFHGNHDIVVSKTKKVNGNDGRMLRRGEDAARWHTVARNGNAPFRTAGRSNGLSFQNDSGATKLDRKESQNFLTEWQQAQRTVFQWNTMWRWWGWWQAPVKLSMA